MEGLMRRIISALITYVIGMLIKVIITGNVTILLGIGSGDREILLLIYCAIIYLSSVVVFCLDPLDSILKDYFKE